MMRLGAVFVVAVVVFLILFGALRWIGVSNGYVDVALLAVCAVGAALLMGSDVGVVQRVAFAISSGAVMFVGAFWILGRFFGEGL